MPLNTNELIRRAEQQLTSGLQHLRQALNQFHIILQVLDGLQANDLIKASELVDVVAEVTQIECPELDALDAEDRGPAACRLKLALRERRRNDFVPGAGRIYTESAVSTPGVERPRLGPAQVSPDPEPAVEHEGVAVNQQRRPAEETQDQIGHASQ